MSTRVRDLLMERLDELRYEPIDKRIRGVLGGHTAVDSTASQLVWEPKRIVPSYAVPNGDIDGEIMAAADQPGAAVDPVHLGSRPVYDPSIPFAVHTTPGEALEVRAGGRAAAAFRPADESLSDHLILDFAGFDAWYEEDERNVAHPRDPFHRIDIVHSSRHVRIERDGTVLAESRRAHLLFEPPLPVRYYLPAEDVAMELLEPSDTQSFCAYKGEASYWSLDGVPDVAWTYRAPLREASEVTDRVAFFNERVDVIVDGTRLDRPVTPWSR
jgi:uncharacterized protein (DUF427 family)